MELNEIVETKFLPPESVQEYDGTKSDFGVDITDGGFIPWTLNLNDSTKKYFIDKSGTQAHAGGWYSKKQVFDTIEKARKHVWKYFNHNRLHYKPKVEADQ